MKLSSRNNLMAYPLRRKIKNVNMYRLGNLSLIEYYTENRVYTANFTLTELVNDGAIINQSVDCNITVNNVLLVVGQEYNFGGNYGEINNQIYIVNIVPLAGTPQPKIVVLIKRYKGVTQK